MKLLFELKRRNVLRVAAAYVVMSWLVIQVVETILPAFGFADAIVRYVTIAAAVGLVPVLILSWVFELTPEGLKKDSEVDPTESIAPKTGKMLDRVIMVVLALAVAYFGFDKFIVSPVQEAAKAERVAAEIDEAREQGRTEALIESFGDHSIAVLPFVNMSPDPDQEYFSDGISEELLNLLARIPELRVISRTSAFSFKGKNINIADVAEQLNVAHVLEGSVRKSGQRLRITAQLIDARSDTHLWSETYDRDMGDIFAIQEDIAAVVVDRLRLEILGDRPASISVDPRAYELVLRARPLSRSGNSEELEEAVALYQQALVIEPEYAIAWDELAVTYDNMTTIGLLSVEEGVLLMRSASERALELDPYFAPSHAQMAWISLYYDSDPQAAAAHLERAHALDSDHLATLGITAALLNSLGRLAEALRINQWILSRDPLRVGVLHNTSVLLFMLGRFDEAMDSWRELLRQRPDHYGTHYFVGLAMLYQDRPGEALAQFELEPYEPLAVAGRALAYHELGRREEHQVELARLVDEWGDQAATSIARVHARTGQVNLAIDWLERAVEAGRSGQINPSDPGYEPLRDSPRWNTLLERMGKTPSQLDAIQFDPQLPDECPSGGDCPETPAADTLST